MPNYDLGVAHGRIKIDSDTRGATSAQREMKKLESESSTLSARLASLEKALTRVEQSNVALSKSLGNASTNFSRLNKDVSNASDRMRRFSEVSRTAKRNLDDLVRSSGLSEQSLRRLAFNAISARLALKRLSESASDFKKFQTVLGSFGVSFAGARRHALGLTLAVGGINKEMRNAPTWRKNMMSFAGTLGTVASAIGIISRFKKVKSLAWILGGGLGGGLGGSSYQSINRTIAALKNLHKTAGNLSRSLATFGIGIAAVKVGLGQLGQSFQFFKKIPLPVLAAVVSSFQVLPELLGSTARGLRIISNTLVGTTGALRQLSGMFLALPGIIAMGGALFATIKTVFGGLGDQLKDLFDPDPTKAQEAFAKLDDSVKPLGKSLMYIVKNFKDVQKVLRTEAFGKGLDKQLNGLSDAYLPRLQSGMLAVVKSTRGITDQVFANLMRPETQGVISGVFQRLAQVMKSFTPAMKPMLDGFMRLTDISTRFVSGALNSMSSGFTNMMDRFAKWAASGKALNQMLNAFVGLKKSVVGLKDLWMGLYNILALFATNPGVKGIDSFANAMKRFNDGVQKSALNGKLAQFRDFMNSFKNESFDKIQKSWSNFMRLMDSLWPVIKNIGDAINGPLNSAMSAAITIFNAFLNIINALHLDTLLGTILGLAGSFKLLTAAARPLRGLATLFAGVIATVTGFRGTMLAAGAALTQFIGASRQIGPRLTGVAGGVNKIARGGAIVGRLATGMGAALAGLATGPIGIATIASLALFEAFRGGADEMKNTQATIDETAKHVSELGNSISQAFVQDEGLSGRSVFSTVSQGVNQMMSDLQSQASNAPGIMAHIRDAFRNPFLIEDGKPVRDGGMFSDSPELNRLQKASADAKQAQEKFKELGLTTSDLTRIVMSSEAEFNKQAESIRASGNGGNEAADVLKQQHEVFQQIQRDFQAIGTGGAQFAKGIDIISQAAGDATTKLQGLRLILQGLGILKTTSYEAAAQFAEVVQTLGDKAYEAASNVSDLGDTIDKATGDINVNSSAGRALLSVLEQATDAFLNTATAGNDIDSAFGQIQNQLGAVADAFHIPIESVQKFVQQLGGVPDIVRVSVALDGKDNLTKDLAQLYMVTKTYANQGIGVPVHLIGADSPDAAKSISDEINKIVGSITETDGTNIKLKAGIDPASIAKLEDELKRRGVPVSPGALQNGIPAQVIPNIPNLPVAQLPIPANQAPANPAPINQAPPPAPTGPANPAPMQTAPVQQEAQQQAADLQQATAAVQEAAGKWSEYSDAVSKAMSDSIAAIQNFSSEALGVLTAASDGAKASGALFAANYAIGILQNVGLVEQAANAVAAAAASPTKPGSPPKTGPLSRGGWSLYSGQKFTKAYAQGISQYAGLVGNAASAVAGMAGSGIGGGGSYLGLNSGGLSGGMDQILNQSSRMVQFMSNFAGVVQQIGQSIFQALSFFADPLGKGTFFGQHKGFIRDPNVTDKMLADRLADKEYAKTHDGNVPNEVAKEQKAVAKGRPLSARQTLAANDPSQRQIAQTIYNRAVDQGYSNSDALAIVAAGMGQSGLSVSKGLFGNPTPGVSGGQAVSEQITDFLQQIYQAQSGNIYARIREVGRQGDYDFTNIRSNEPNARILIAPGDTDTGYTTTTQGTKGGRGHRKNVPEYDQLGNQVTSYEPGQKADVQILGGNLDISGDVLSAIQTGISPIANDEEVLGALKKIQSAIDQQTAIDTPASRATAGGLESAKSQIMSSKGFAEDTDPISKMSGAFSDLGNIAQNVFGLIQSSINAVGGAKAIGDQLVRGISSTDDIVNVVTQVQKFVDLAAKVASTVSSVASVVGQAASSTQFSAPAQAVAAISQIVAGALQGVNAAIDLGKEAWEIFGSYFGQFLGMLAGGQNQLQGNVRFLLDAQAGQLQAYSANNPNNKFAHSIPGVAPTLGPNGGNMIGQINMYSGPGSDPRDDTANMLYQIGASRLQGALAS